MEYRQKKVTHTSSAGIAARGAYRFCCSPRKNVHWSISDNPILEIFRGCVASISLTKIAGDLGIPFPTYVTHLWKMHQL